MHDTERIAICISGLVVEYVVAMLRPGFDSRLMHAWTVEKTLCAQGSQSLNFKFSHPKCQGSNPTPDNMMMKTSKFEFQALSPQMPGFTPLRRATTTVTFLPTCARLPPDAFPGPRRRHGVLL
eukprot:780063-Amphidinium_carterae.1